MRKSSIPPDGSSQLDAVTGWKVGTGDPFASCRYTLMSLEFSELMRKYRILERDRRSMKKAFNTSNDGKMEALRLALPPDVSST